MAILLGKKSAIQPLVDVVSHVFDSIRLIESYDNIRRPHAWIKPELVVVTDSFPGGLNRHILDYVKATLAPARILCLGQFISPGNEVDLRSSGLVFMGSYDEFLRDAVDILRPLGKKAPSERAYAVHG